MKKLFLSITFLFLSALAIAGGNVSSTVLEGKIIDDEGNPVIGAKVVLIGSQKEAYTDFEGAFRFEKVATIAQKIKVNYISHEELITEVNLSKSEERQIELQLDSK